MDGGALEFVIRVLGGPTAAASAREVAGALNSTAAAQEKANAAAKGGIAANAGLARALKYTGLAALGVAFEATKMGVEFDAQMERIHTQAGLAQKEVDSLRGKVLDLASSGASMGAGPNSLAEALYHLASLRLPKTINLMDALKVAAQGAAVGGSDLSDTASALGATIKAAIPGTTSLSGTMGTLNAIVGAGNMHMQDLIDALGTGILPVAGLAGISLQQVGAALAELTDQGYPASSAATQLATAMHFLYSPTQKATDALSKIGIKHYELAQQMRSGPRGLISALLLLRSHLRAFSSDPNVQMGVLGDIFPGGRGRTLQVLLAQLREGFPQQKLAQVFQGQGAFPGAVAATQRTAAVQLAEAWANVQANLIRLYDVLRPLMIPALLAVAAAASAIVSSLGYLVHGSGVVHDLVLALTIAFGSYAVALGVAAVATTALSVALGILEFLISPAGLIVLGIAAIAFAAIEVVHHWSAVKGALGGVWRWMATAARNTADAVKGAFVSAINWLLRAWNSIHLTLPSFNTHIPGVGTIGGETLSVPQVPLLGQGTAGAVLPKHARPARGLPGGIFGPPQQINVVVDGQVLARSMHRQTQSQQARGG